MYVCTLMCSTKEDCPGVGVTGASELNDKGMGNGTLIHYKNNMLLLQSQVFFLLNYFSQVFVTTVKCLNIQTCNF